MRLVHRYLMGLCGLCLTASLAQSATPKRIVSLDLCSDWLLAHYAPNSSHITLSPMGKRFGLPAGSRQWLTHNGSLEKILSLNPDVVVVGEFNAYMLRKRLESLGVKVIVTPLPKTLDDLDSIEFSIRELLGLSVETPMQRSADIQSKLPEANSPKLGRLLLLGANGYGTGRNTFEDSLISRAGWVNYIERNGHVKLDLETLASDPPDAIVWATPRNPALANQFAQHPVLKRAVPANKWIHTDYWRWQCSGPWTYTLIEQLQP